MRQKSNKIQNFIIVIEIVKDPSKLAFIEKVQLETEQKPILMIFNSRGERRLCKLRMKTGMSMALKIDSDRLEKCIRSYRLKQLMGIAKRQSKNVNFAPLFGQSYRNLAFRV